MNTSIRTNRWATSVRAGLIALFAVAALLSPARAGAQAGDAKRVDVEANKKAARPHYEKGATEYNLGHFPEAIAEFERAYQLDPAPILLFNIAQAHRQNSNNERAAFFYRRYLEQEPNAANRADVEKRIKDLEDAVRQQNDLKRRPPTEVAKEERDARVPQQQDTQPPPGPAVTQPPAITSPNPVTGGGGAAGADVPAITGKPPAAEEQRSIRLAFSAGPAFPSFSGRDLAKPTLLSLRASGGYTVFRSGPAAVDVGLSLAFAPLQYRTIDTGSNQTGSFWGALATGTFRYRVIPALDLHGELGAGVLWWGGLDAGNPFTVAGAASSGPVPMPSFLIGVGASYILGSGIFVFAEPAFVYSKTTGAGLTDGVSAVSRFDLALGIGYAL
jgi:hypothetical protein